MAKVLMDEVPPLIRWIRAELRASAPKDLSFPQFRVLANIHAGLQTVSAIAEHHGVSQPAMTRMVGNLVRRGLIEQTNSKRDGRQILLSLTPEGHRVYATTWSAAQERIAKRLEKFPLEQRNTLFQTFCALRNCLPLPSIDLRQLPETTKKSISLQAQVT